MLPGMHLPKQDNGPLSLPPRDVRQPHLISAQHQMDEIVDLLGRYEGVDNAVIVSPGILLVYQPAQDALQCQAIPLL